MKSVLIGAASVAAAILPRPTAPVTALAAAQGHVAYAAAWSGARCERVATSSGSFGPRICPAVSTGRGIAAVELAGRRVLWLGYAGGNDRDWTVETATPTRPAPRQLLFVERDVEQRSPVLLGPSDGSLLVYASGRRVVALRADGSRAFVWQAPVAVTAVAAAGGRVAAALGTGEVDVVERGSVRRRYAVGGAPSSVAVAGDAVIAQVGQTLSRRTGGLGPEYTLQLPNAARLEDGDASRAVYVAGGNAHLVTFPQSGQPQDRVVGPAQHAQIDGRRLVLAHGRTLVVKPI
jgi:hypothetical protein